VVVAEQARQEQQTLVAVVVVVEMVLAPLAARVL
jgi:hypothetical protein